VKKSTVFCLFLALSAVASNSLPAHAGFFDSIYKDTRHNAKMKQIIESGVLTSNPYLYSRLNFAEEGRWLCKQADLIGPANLSRRWAKEKYGKLGPDEGPMTNSRLVNGISEYCPQHMGGLIDTYFAKDQAESPYSVEQNPYQTPQAPQPVSQPATQPADGITIYNY
jgi:hypothetical protein